jgi:acyl-coenzyme A thioesterase 9
VEFYLYTFLFLFLFACVFVFLGDKNVANKLVEIWSRPSGRYGMFRDLWALRLASFGRIDRQGGLPFSTSASDSSSVPLTESRSMTDSLIQVSLPFLDNKELFGDYVNIFGGVRFGKIMEDLDVFAATCAYMHCGTSTTKGEKLTIVTAAVDRIDVHMRLDEPVNLRMKGMVSFVGKSSMEVTIVVESSKKTSQIDDGTVSVNQMIKDLESEPEEGGAGEWKMAALAKFIMVARNSEGPVQVPRLKLNSEREEAIFAAGAERHAARLSRAQQSLFKEPPTEAESNLLHRLFLNPIDPSRSLTESRITLPISATVLTTTKLCHPQERNIHDLIFGGYLMREAFELGFTCAQLFSHSQLHFLAVDELAFKHPVPIGAVLQLTSQVVYTQDELPASQLVHVEVVADVLNIQSGDRKTTNTFHFTYRLESAPKYSVKPGTYAEAMKYLEGKRRISAAPLDPSGTIYKF